MGRRCGIYCGTGTPQVRIFHFCGGMIRQIRDARPKDPPTRSAHTGNIYSSPVFAPYPSVQSDTNSGQYRISKLCIILPLSPDLRVGTARTAVNWLGFFSRPTAPARIIATVPAWLRRWARICVRSAHAPPPIGCAAPHLDFNASNCHGVIVSIPCALQSNTTRSIKRDICATS